MNTDTLCTADYQAGGTSCPEAYPTCRDFIAGQQWGSCWGTTTESGSFDLSPRDKSNAQVQLVRQGHAVSHIIATDLAWNVPVEQCEDVAEPSANRDNMNCNSSYT